MRRSLVLVVVASVVIVVLTAIAFALFSSAPSVKALRGDIVRRARHTVEQVGERVEEIVPAPDPAAVAGA